MCSRGYSIVPSSYEIGLLFFSNRLVHHCPLTAGDYLFWVILPVIRLWPQSAMLICGLTTPQPWAGPERVFDLTLVALVRRRLSNLMHRVGICDRQLGRGAVQDH